MVLNVIFCVVIYVQYRSVLSLEGKLHMIGEHLIGLHYSSLLSINDLTTRLIESDTLSTDLSTLSDLLRHVDAAYESYGSAMVTLEIVSSSDIKWMLAHYRSILSSYISGNVLGMQGIDMVADHQFISAVSDLQLFSEWALSNYLAKQPPLILYTAVDLDVSGIIARLQLYPTP